MTPVFSALLIAASIIFGQGARILVVSPTGTHSHFALGFRLAKELVDRGHEVTFINAFPQKKPIKNLREISVATVKAGMENRTKDLLEVGKMTYIGQLVQLSKKGVFYTEKVLRVKEVQDLLHSNEQFDLVLMEDFVNEAMAIFQHKFKCPSVILTAGPPTIFTNHRFANPSQPAYVPNLLNDFGSHMTLWERLLNVFHEIVGELYVHFVNIPNQNEILQRILPGAPDVKSILYNSSFLLLLSHISLRDPAPLQPNVKEIGGYHILPPKLLPKDLQEFLDGAREGAIVFSMGSNLKSADFPQEKTEAILKVFSRLKQKVLWKYETDLPGKPANVKIMSWIPQQDVLAHPNFILFITHVGLLGKIEAIYYGIPFLGLPVFWDQKKNSHDSVRQGFALTIPFSQLTEENFNWSVNELINNPKYKENAKIRSQIMRDQPVKQMDEAMFWIEYTIRHKGAPHYRSPALNLRWYQRLLLDIILVLFVAVMIIFAIVFCVVKKCFANSRRNVKRNKRE